jgi:hypothetical protein
MVAECHFFLREARYAGTVCAVGISQLPSSLRWKGGGLARAKTGIFKDGFAHSAELAIPGLAAPQVHCGAVKGTGWALPIPTRGRVWV